jgi:hypothetical protein
MKKMSAVCLLFLVVGMLGCNAAKQAGNAAPTGTDIPAGTWVVTINNFIGGETDTVTVVNPYPNGTLVYDAGPPAVGYTSCDNDGLTYYNPPQNGGTPVVGPACFVALGGGCNGGCGPTPQNITSSTTDAEPLNFIIGVPTNPVPNASTFNIQFAEAIDATSGETLWQMDGTGTITNGTASGTWVCDPSTPECSGITGTFTATQQ